MRAVSGLFIALIVLSACSSGGSPTTSANSGGLGTGSKATGVATGTGTGGSAGAGESATSAGTQVGSSSAGSGTSGTTTGPASPIGLWVGGAGAISNVDQGGNHSFTDTCPQPNSFYPMRKGPAVIDGQGDLFVMYQEGNSAIYVWNPTELMEQCNPDAGIVLTSSSYGNPQAPYDAIGGMAFDSLGTLWVTSPSNSTILGFRAEDLRASGSIAPAWQLSAVQGDAGPAALQNPMGLAFDSAGYLWVGNSVSVIAFSPATLATAFTDGGPSIDADGGLPGTQPFPDLQIDTVPADDAGNPLPEGYLAYSFQYVTFDHSGNLWVTFSAPESGNLSSRIYEFTAAQLASLGTDDRPVPATTIGAEAISNQTVTLQFSPVAFEQSGEMFVGFAESQPNLFRYSPGETTPDRVMTVLGGCYGSLVFDPIPSGLPIQP